MKRPVRDPVKGTYTVKNKEYKELFGSREQVWNGTAYKTKSGLTKSNLTMNKWGRIVSLNKHITAKKEMRLKKYGYSAKKGKFGYVKISSAKKSKSKSKTSKSKDKKMNGGEPEVLKEAEPHTENSVLKPAAADA
jgi:hypothetical protein